MIAIRNIYEKMPDTIEIPEELRQKKVEVIILSLDDSAASEKCADIKSLYGSIPDFPERESQGEFESREPL